MSNRAWMYNGWQHGTLSNEWIDGTNAFLNSAFLIPGVAENDTIKCPCAQCRNYFRHTRYNVSMHLCKHGFKEDYETWTEHGEGMSSYDGYDGVGNREGTDEVDQIDQMLVDLAGHHPPVLDAEPTAYAKAFYRMVASADELVHDNTTHSRLSAVARLIAVKSRYNMPIAEYDDILGIVHELLPPDSRLPNDFYQSRKLLEGLGMPYIKIDVCYNNCMLFYKDNINKEKCDFCGTSRYKEGGKKVARKVLRYLPIKDRLQRLYLHADTAKLMRSYSPTTCGKMVHPCDGEAWQQFNVDYPEFVEEKRNVCLAVATDGFQPFDVNAAPYSCWPVFVTSLNLPPGTLLKSEYIFLALIIPGPEHPGRKMNVLMQPIVDEFQELWNGVTTWDASLKEEFTMKAIYLWSVHDFKAYGDFSGWSTNGRMSCPYGFGCRGFLLPNGRKPCWFDIHRRFLPEDHAFRNDANAFRKNTEVFDEAPRYLTGEEVQAHVNQFAGDTQTYGKLHNWMHVLCFRQLPYFHKLLLPHNIDVMHNEKNMGEAIWNTCFDIAEKRKDNVKARLDLAIICNRPSMHLVQKSSGKWDRPKGPFSVPKDVKPTILQWFKDLKFPDSYASNLKRGVSFQNKKIFGLKSHDYHIFMERLLPVVFRGFLSDNVWRCLAEISFFYRQLCAKELKKYVVRSMEENVAVLLCKMEKIFPPGFFNVMQHLIIHLPYEARLGGPVLARWCYPYERQFEYVHYPAPYKYTTQLGAILRREYPGVLVEVDENGNEFQRPALDWADYFHENPGARGTTRGQKVLSEFWCLFQVAEGHEQHADRVLQECLKKRVRDMMYQVRVDAVKEYYNNIKHIQIKNAVARHIELEYEQYKQGQLEGFSDEVWLLLCAYWCSDEYKEKRKRGQISRSSNEDIAQNRGGSRPFTETRQVLEANFGPQKATHVNTFGAMKCGLKSLDSNGRCGPISSHKAQRRMLKSASLKIWSPVPYSSNLNRVFSKILG